MRTVPYDLKKISNLKHYKKSELQNILEEFLESGADCVKIEGWTQKTAMSCASSLNVAAKRYKLTGARALSRNGEVFLVKASLLK